MRSALRRLSGFTVYTLVAILAALFGLGAARQYVPELYSGFSAGLTRLPVVKELSAVLPAMPPLLSGDDTGALPGAGADGTGTAPSPELPDLTEEEEMRGVWIATVYGIDFPANRSDPERQKQELIDILRTVKDAGLNTVFFQVRPHGDAFYASSVFPWSEYLTGTAGQDPGYDPLAFLLEEAEKRGIRVHAWINPYRLTAGTTVNPQNTHDFLPDVSPVKNRPDLTMTCGDGKLYLNPGEPEAMRLVVDGVKEIVEKYNVDGIHFDDYFYPSDTSYDDGAAYEKYGRPAGLSREDWRRYNTTTLMKMVGEAIREIRPGVEFGISPSGIWQNRQSSSLGSDTNGFESYNRIFADTRLWVTDEVVDYIVPQIYWAIGTQGSDYDVLVRWWRNVALGTRVKLYIGHAAYRVGAEGAWQKPTEIGSQITLNRALGTIDGSVFYGYSNIAMNTLGLRDQLKELFIDMNNAQPLKIAYPAAGAAFTAANSYIIGSADPRYPLTLGGEAVDCTVGGYFSVYVPLEVGENEFLFSHNGTELPFILQRSPSSAGAGTGTGTPGGGSAPQGPAETELPQPLVYVTKEDLTVVRAGASANTERLQPLKKGVTGYVLAEANGYYRMDSGNWTYKPNVEVLAEGESLPACRAESARIAPGENWVELAFRLPYFTSYYVDVADTEVRLTLHQTEGLPLLREGADPLFGEIAYSQEGGHAVYMMPLKKAGRLYGYHIHYEESTGLLTFRFNNPISLPANWSVPAAGLPGEAQTAPGGQTAPGTAVPGASGESGGAAVPGAAEAAPGAASGVPAAAAGDGGFRTLAGGQTVSPGGLPVDIARPLAGKVIVLDAGHGGRDNGATGPAGERGKLEKDVNLDLALVLEAVLKEAGAEVRMTRTEDVYVELTARADQIREIKPDLAISLHRNSMGAQSDISTYYGALTLYSHQQSASLAQYLREALVTGTGHHDGGSRWQSLAMCRMEECPAVILELGFISNPAEYERMTRKSNIQKEARAILRGLIAYMAAG